MENKKYFVGIDGGGTKAFIRVVDMDNNIIYEGVGGSTNLCSNSEDRVLDNLINLFAPLSNLNFKGICLGTAGISKTGAEFFLSQLIETITSCNNIKVVGDMEIPLYANAFNENAISLVSGTGSICYGKNINGMTARSGGWGHIFDDEGSGYWIGCRGLNAVLSAFDGRGSETFLTQLLLEKFQSKSSSEIVSKIYAKDFNKTEIAENSYFVQLAADNGDKIAIGILKEAALKLSLLVKGVVSSLGLEKSNFRVLLSGSVIIKNKIVNDNLRTIINDYYNQAIITTIEKDAAWGAIEIAKIISNNVK